MRGKCCKGRIFQRLLRDLPVWIPSKNQSAPSTAGGLTLWDYTISCSNESNSGVEKKAPNVISSPSHSFLIVIIETSRLRWSNKLYTVDGVIPEILDNSFGLMPFSLQRNYTLSTTASLTVILSPQGNCKKCNAKAYTRLRIRALWVSNIINFRQTS